MISSQFFAPIYRSLTFYNDQMLVEFEFTNTACQFEFHYLSKIVNLQSFILQSINNFVLITLSIRHVGPSFDVVCFVSWSCRGVVVKLCDVTMVHVRLHLLIQKSLIRQFKYSFRFVCGITFDFGSMNLLFKHSSLNLVGFQCNL